MAYKDPNRKKQYNREYNKKRLKENPLMHVEKNLKHRYGITLKEYESQLKAQDNKCKICGAEACPTGDRFAVDHCHETGKLRALLCQHCNTGIGLLKHDKNLLEKAIDYLEEDHKFAKIEPAKLPI